MELRSLPESWAWIPNCLSVLRVLMVVGTLASVPMSFEVELNVFVVMVGCAFALDALDGIVARRLQATSMLGSTLDILADRIVEFCFIGLFAWAKVVPVGWIVAFYSRVVLTDVCRVYAVRYGHGTREGLNFVGVGRWLVLSKPMRTGYGAAKLLLFMVGGGQVVCRVRWESAEGILPPLLSLVLMLSFIRGFPILVRYGGTATRGLLQDVHGLVAYCAGAVGIAIELGPAGSGGATRSPANRMRKMESSAQVANLARVQVMCDLLAVIGVSVIMAGVTQ